MVSVLLCTHGVMFIRRLILCPWQHSPTWHPRHQENHWWHPHSGQVTIRELLEMVRQVLERCWQHQITLSNENVCMGNTIRFAEYILSDQGVCIDPDKLKAIRDFLEPMNITKLQSFLGLANQLGHFLPDLAHVSTPLWMLLKQDVAWLWLPEHSAAMAKTKAALLKPSETYHFDPQKKSHLFTDASHLHGVGHPLIQYDRDHPYLVQCGSRSLSSTKANYAIIELECLAIIWAIQKCRIYLQDLTSMFTQIINHWSKFSRWKA